MIEEGVNQLLSADAALSALVGSSIYPVLVPEQTTWPCVSYQVASSVTDYTVDGAAETAKRMQFDCWGLTYASTKQVQTAVSNVLDGFTGLLPDGTVIKGAFRGVDLDAYDSGHRVFRALVEYVFHYVEP